MDTLKAMQVFVEVARQHGFAPAAKNLGLSTSQISRHIQNLESEFGVRLFNRTTRHLSLTPAGKGLLGPCQRITTDFNSLVQSSHYEQVEPNGTLRVTMPTFIAHEYSRTILPSYALKHPKVDLDVIVTDRTVNLIEEGFDLAVRAGELADSSLISRKLTNLSLALVASPCYIDKRGVPAAPADLHYHNCIVETGSPYGDLWTFKIGRKTQRIRANGNIRVNKGHTARQLAIESVGLALLPDYMVQDDIQKKRLISVLAEQITYDGAIYVIYPQTRHLDVVVRSFIDELLHKTRFDGAKANL
jgi:DNA-binding transcriptional LysR family regulator